MNWLNKAKILVGVLSGIGLFASCSSNTEELLNESGTGFVSFSIQANAGFQTTRAASEDYEDVNNYTVQILQGNKIVGDSCEWEYSKLPDEIELPNGEYTLKAFYGKEEAVSSTAPYVEGTKDFEVSSNLQNVEVSCKPTSAKVSVTFDEKMDEYFSDYSVTITTKALTNGQIWSKDDSEDIYYLKVEEKEQIEMAISLTNKETEKSFKSTKTYTVSPGDYKNYTIAPKASESGDGSLSITISFNDETTDHEVDITIPADWK